MRILLVEDDLAEQKAALYTLEDIFIGWEIDVIASYSELEDSSWDVGFFDINLVGSSKNGLEIADELMKKNKVKTVIILTTSIDTRDIEYVKKIGANAYIEKVENLSDYEASIQTCYDFFIDKSISLEKVKKEFVYVSQTIR